MILSLADDADEEFMGDVMFKEAEPFDVEEVTSEVRLSSSCEERESEIDRIDSAAVDRLETFLES